MTALYPDGEGIGRIIARGKQRDIYIYIYIYLYIYAMASFVFRVVDIHLPSVYILLFTSTTPYVAIDERGLVRSTHLFFVFFFLCALVK